jgi:hypothetical protein
VVAAGDNPNVTGNLWPMVSSHPGFPGQLEIRAIRSAFRRMGLTIVDINRLRRLVSVELAVADRETKDRDPTRQALQIESLAQSCL